MFKKLYLFLVFIGILFFSLPVLAETINKFQTDIFINSDSSLKVSELINYDFGTEQKHGIVREIIYKYKARGGNYNLRINNVSVRDENGQKIDNVVSTVGDSLSIKIGSADKLVTGEKIYKISYQVSRAVNYLPTGDEIYWNATGNGWNVPINSAIFTVHLPDKVTSEKVDFVCYTGKYGSNVNCEKKEIQNKNIIFSQTNLEPGSGLTAAVKFPSGTLSKPTKKSSTISYLVDNYIIFLPFVVLIVMFLLWRSKGKDPAGRGTIITQFDPPAGMNPLEVGVLADTKVNNSDLSAEIIYLAVKGNLEIERVGETKDFILRKKKELPEKASETDKILFEFLFKDRTEVKISALKNSFLAEAKKIFKKAYEKVTADGYFISNPEKARGKYYLIGFLTLFAGMFVGDALHNMSYGIAFVVSGLIVVLFSRIMPAYSESGVVAKEHILGFKSYLNVAEKDRINFHNAPEKNPKQFEEFLPFAMALGVEQAWAKQFEGIYSTPPTWYRGHYNNFSSVWLASELVSFKKESNIAINPKNSAAGGRSGFGGGGFSGGGFGGGGGRSW